MAVDVDLTGKAILIFLVIVLTLVLFPFAPSFGIVIAIFLILLFLAWLIWLIVTGINRRGRRFFGGG